MAEGSGAFWGVEGGESQGRAAPGDPVLLKKADISLMYFTAADRGRGKKKLYKGRQEI